MGIFGKVTPATKSDEKPMQKDESEEIKAKPSEKQEPDTFIEKVLVLMQEYAEKDGYYAILGQIEDAKMLFREAVMSDVSENTE